MGLVLDAALGCAVGPEANWAWTVSAYTYAGPMSADTAGHINSIVMSISSGQQ